MTARNGRPSLREAAWGEVSRTQHGGIVAWDQFTSVQESAFTVDSGNRGFN